MDPAGAGAARAHHRHGPALPAARTATQPIFQTTYRTTGTCRTEPTCGGTGYDRRDSGRYFASDAASAGDGGASVSVYFRGGVGPYDAAILSSTDATALRTWLTDNGYDIPAAAGALLDHYVALDHYFVALRLQQDRGVGEIQPIVLKYRESYPCLPIRLTAISTIPDMPITAYVLASSRGASANYMSITPNLEVPDLYVYGTRTYAQIVSSAIDDAGGHAFVTEYAGAPPSVYLAATSVDDLASVTDVQAFVSALLSRGFTGDSQLLGLLTRFIPPPEGVEPMSFYNCLASSCGAYDSYLGTLPFDPAAFVAALNEAIVIPRREAQSMVESHAKLTRLFTTMSAEEMTEDPVFMLMPPDSRDVSNVHTAELITECSGEYFGYSAPQFLQFESGRRLRTRTGVSYRGTDAEYCDDLRAGLFGPGVPTSTLVATSARRAAGTSARDDGGLCAAAPRSAGARGAAVTLGVVLAAVLALAGYRRRTRAKRRA